MESRGRPVDLNSNFEIRYLKFSAIPTALSSPQIIFLFSNRISFSVWESRPQRILLSQQHCHSTSMVSVNLAQFHDIQQTFSLVKQKTESFLVHAQFYENLFAKVHAYAVQTLRSIPSTHTLIFIHCYLTVHHDAILRPTPIDGIISSNDSSIQSLQTTKVTSGNCSICLEELCEVSASMPCQHVFHGDCITKWLNINHSCPLCRFPMPTAP